MSYSNQQAFLLENVPCNNASCKSARRMFKVFWELSDLNQIKDAVVATFFDIYEDVSSTLYCSKASLLCCCMFCVILTLPCINIGFTARGRQCFQTGMFLHAVEMLSGRWAGSSSPFTD